MAKADDHRKIVFQQTHIALSGEVQHLEERDLSAVSSCDDAMLHRIGGEHFICCAAFPHELHAVRIAGYMAAQIY